MKKTTLLMLFIFIFFAASPQQLNKFQKTLTKEDYKNYFMSDVQNVNIGINFPLNDTIQLVCILPTNEKNKELMNTANNYYAEYINSFYPNLKFIKYKIVTDEEALQADLSGCSIRTFGTREGNLWTKWFLSQMSDFPIKIYGDSIVADKCYPGNTFHVYAVWYNPFNLKHGVILNIPQNAEHFEFPRGRDLAQFQLFKRNDTVCETYYHLKDGHWVISDMRDKLLDYKIDIGNKLMEKRFTQIMAHNNLSPNISTSERGSNAIAPKIISTIPEFGDCNVDPGLTEIIIKFDQDMGNGMSVINTENMPENNGQPKWIDNRTFLIPIKLYSNKFYSVAFNNSRFQNFTNVSGVPLNPDILLFKTKAVSSKNKEAFKELQEIFPKKYSYGTIKGINWMLLLEQNRSEFEAAETPLEFAIKLIKLLRISNDPHLWVEVEGKRFETGKLRIVENNYNSAKLFERLLEQKVSKNFMVIAGVIDSIGYISLKDWNTDLDRLFLKDLLDSKIPEISVNDELRKLLNYPNLIIDVRENSGGNELFAKKFAGYFTKDSTAYEKTRNYNEKTGKFDYERIKYIYPNEKNKEYLGNVYVLSGPSVMSSNESFILMMKQMKNVKIIGMKTYGSSGNPSPYELSNGIKIYIPSWQAYTLEGNLIEGNGIKPDIEITTTRNDFRDKDVLFEKVVEMIKKNDQKNGIQ